jgi:putative membrane-bound dehydrogenase-like protein
MLRTNSTLGSLAPLLVLCMGASAQEPGWQTTQLAEDFTCEGASFGDLNGDGVNDVVAGPFWYAGPDFKTRRRYYDGLVYDSDHYSDHFFSWVRDFNGDGHQDVFVITFPGKPAYWFENPGPAGGEAWERHLVHDNVDNESPAFVDVNGDGLEDLVCHSGGVLCWLERNPADPAAAWVRHDLSPNLELGRFTHGLGVGDVSGDGRPDVILNSGYWEQPPSLEGDPPWGFRPFQFSRGQGGAQMLVTDVDGDGDGDVVTSLNAHKYGLAWFENVVNTDSEAPFVKHGIMGNAAGAFDCPLAVSELHALALADVNGDGLADVVTGKRWKSHGFGELGARDPAYLLWFELVRDDDGARYQVHIAHEHSGVGTQVTAGDVDGDGRVDLVVGNKMGVFLHLQRGDGARPVLPGPAGEDEGLFPAGGVAPTNDEGRVLNLDFETGDLRDWTAEGDAFEGQPILGDTVLERARDMPSDHVGAYWIGGYELHGDGREGSLTSEAFTLTLPFAAFMIAGGAHSQTRVDIVTEDGTRLASVAGRNHESLRPTVVDLTEFVGQRVRIKVVDEHSGGWGHVNFDHFRLYAQRPVFPEGLEVSGDVDVRAHAGLKPEEAARAMTVPEGFHVDLIAGEPDLFQPIAFTIDERGRLWVAEAHSYPIKRESAEEAKDQILIFEDTDGDGTFEKRTVFTTGLNLVSGIEVGYGGVFVGQAPELLFIPDADGDDVPDGPPRILLDGFGYQDTHETLNAFIWGPDGWLYGCHGVFTHSKVGPPGTPDDERVPLNAGVWRYHPRTGAFEVFAWGSSNPWGLDFDDRGQPFITACVIPHLYHVIQGARYVRQGGTHFNPYVYADIPTIADHLHYIGATPHSGNGLSDDAGGGHAHCGAMIYLGDVWPERYRDTLFVFNVHGNRMNNEVLVPARSGYVGLHGDDFLLANDQWFRGINLRTGPDGQVYMIDWYDQQACHYVSDDIWNRTNGRLYRVSYGEGAPVRVDLGAMDEAQLIELQGHPNDWYVRTARRLIGERGLSEAGVARLRAMLADESTTPTRLRALWTLHVGRGLDEATLLGLIEDADPDLRAWAVQLACENGAPSRSFLAAMELHAASDPSPVVRLYLASAMQRLPLVRRWAIARALLSRGEDADDPNLPYLIWYGVEPLVPTNPVGALRMARTARVPKVAGWIRRRAAAEQSARGAVLEAMVEATSDGERGALLDETLRALGDRRGAPMPSNWPAVFRDLRARPELEDRAVVLAAIFGDRTAYPALREKLADRGAPQDQRELALDTLVAGRDEATLPLLCACLEEDALRGKALQALGAYDDGRVAPAILGVWQRLNEAQQRDAVSTLTSRSSGALALLAAMEAGQVDRAVLTAFELRKLATLEDAQVNERLAEVWGVVREVSADKGAEIERWSGLLDGERLAAADLPHGRDVFARTCQRCHTLFGEGQTIGPDITGANRADLAYLLQNMVDPNAVIPVEYKVTIVATVDGRILTGILEEQHDDVIVLQTENERLVLDRDEIEAMRADDNSMMPQGQLDTLSEAEVVDLVAYLQSETQVPRLASADNLDAFFDGVTLGGWSGDEALWTVEDGVIVGRTDGLQRNAFLVSDLELGDFRLVVDVQLSPDSENSGIQFRSQVHDGDQMSGYQADVGAGWWGKLYDEHGRGVLVGDEHADAIEPGAWNTYEIVAVGSRVLTGINGHPCVDYTDTEDRSRGRLAFQMHSGGALEVRFRIRSLELDPALELIAVGSGQ